MAKYVWWRLYVCEKGTGLVTKSQVTSSNSESSKATGYSLTSAMRGLVAETVGFLVLHFNFSFNIY